MLENASLGAMQVHRSVLASELKVREGHMPVGLRSQDPQLWHHYPHDSPPVKGCKMVSIDGVLICICPFLHYHPRITLPIYIYVKMHPPFQTLVQPKKQTTEVSLTILANRYRVANHTSPSTCIISCHPHSCPPR